MGEAERVLVLLGQETTKGRLYGGLYLLLGGFVLGLAALGLFLASGTREGAALFAWREAGLALGAVAVTAFFVGISTALPSRRGMRRASYVGMGLCAVAIVLFVVHYPANFNVKEAPGADYTAPDTIVFSLGLALIVAGAFVSVIAYWVQSFGQGPTTEEPWRGPGYEVPDWVVEQDMAEAERRHGWSWGLGDRRDAIQIDVPDLGDDVVIGGRAKVKTVRLSGDRVDKAIGSLQRTRPVLGRPAALPGDWTDDAVLRLRAFRQAKAERPKEYTPRLGFWARLFRRRSRLTPVEEALREAEQGIVVGPGKGPGGGKTIVIDEERDD